MTPRRATVAVFFCLVGILALGAIAQAQTPPAGAAKTRTITVYPMADGCPEGKNPCWDLTRIPVLPGDNIVMVANLTSDSAGTHNLHIVAPVDLTSGGKGVTNKAGGDGGNTGTAEVLPAINFTFPESATEIAFECTLHKGTMQGKLVIASQLTTAEAGAVPELGVHFLSYWVGLIAFMLLFVVYGATFFLFKYNETPTTTDHWDRTEGGRRFSPGMATILAILLAVVVIAALIFLARR